MYNRLEALPVDDILNGIDFMVVFASELYSQAQENEPLTISERLKKYWWVIPVVGASVMVKIIKHYAKMQAKPS